MNKNEKEGHLFEEERQALLAAKADLENAAYQNDGLRERYEWLIGRYSKLLSLTRKIFRISDSQGHILHRHQSEIQNLLDNANQGFLTFGADLIVDRQFSAECVRIFKRKIAGISIVELMEQWSGCDVQHWRGVFARSLAAEEVAGGSLPEFPIVVKIGDMDIRVECKLIIQSREEVAERVIMMILTDVTEKRRSEEYIHFLSYHDKLTGLYNRAYIELVLPELEAQENSPLSVVVVDMNGLKLVNDVFGHGQGDRLLVELAKVSKAVCRNTDIVARWGGDEFIILLPKTTHEICGKICERLQEACQNSVTTPIRLSASLGSATKDSMATNFEELFSIAENRMYSHKLTHRQDFRNKIMQEMEYKLYCQEIENSAHCERVFALSTGFANFLGMKLDTGEQKLLRQLATFHDVGKVAVPLEILHKNQRLNQAEWKIVKSHSDVGYRMAQAIGEMALAELIIALHERWDGKGYPNGLTGLAIPPLARLFVLADVYDVLIHDRPYCRAVDKPAALREIARGKGTQFDPELTEAFVKYMAQLGTDGYSHG